MSKVLILAVCLAQGLDALTWMAMPPAAEVNSVARGLHSADAWLLKIALVVLVVCVEMLLLDPSLRKPILHRWAVPEWVYREAADVVVVGALFAGAVGFGSNIAAIAWVTG